MLRYLCWNVVVLPVEGAPCLGTEYARVSRHIAQAFADLGPGIGSLDDGLSTLLEESLTCEMKKARSQSPSSSINTECPESLIQSYSLLHTPSYGYQQQQECKHVAHVDKIQRNVGLCRRRYTHVKNLATSSCLYRS